MRRVLDDQPLLPERTSSIGVRVHDLRYPADVQVQNLAVVTIQREHRDRGPARHAVDGEAGDVLLQSDGDRVVEDARTRAVVVSVRYIWDELAKRAEMSQPGMGERHALAMNRWWNTELIRICLVAKSMVEIDGVTRKCRLRNRQACAAGLASVRV